jgi:hypothetical protein
MKKIKTALQRLLNNGFTPNQIANELRLLDTTSYHVCPECESGDIHVVEYSLNYGDSDLVCCNTCEHEWHEMRFSFGIENVG